MWPRDCNMVQLYYMGARLRMSFQKSIIPEASYIGSRVSHQPLRNLKGMVQYIRRFGYSSRHFIYILICYSTHEEVVYTRGGVTSF